MTCMGLAHCILGKSFGVLCHCFPPSLDVFAFTARCLYVRNNARDPSSESWNLWARNFPLILPKLRLDLRLYFPSEGRRTDDFFALQIRRFRQSLNPGTWVLKASTLLLDTEATFNYNNSERSSCQRSA